MFRRRATHIFPEFWDLSWLPSHSKKFQYRNNVAVSRLVQAPHICLLLKHRLLPLQCGTVVKAMIFPIQEAWGNVLTCIVRLTDSCVDWWTRNKMCLQRNAIQRRLFSTSWKVFGRLREINHPTLWTQPTSKWASESDIKLFSFSYANWLSPLSSVSHSVALRHIFH